MTDAAQHEVARIRNEARDRLVASEPWMTVPQLASAIARSADNAETVVLGPGEAATLVVVDHPEAGSLVPLFQLDERLNHRRDVDRISRILDGAGMSGWAIWAWWAGYSAVLEERPIEALDRGQGIAVRDAALRLADR